MNTSERITRGENEEFHRSLLSKEFTMRLLNSLHKSGNFPGRGVESQFSERWRVKWVRACLRNDEKKSGGNGIKLASSHFQFSTQFERKLIGLREGKEYQNEEAKNNYFFFLRGKYKRIFECATLKSAVSSNPCTFLIIKTKKVEEIARTADYKRREFPLDVKSNRKK